MDVEVNILMSFFRKGGVEIIKDFAKSRTNRGQKSTNRGQIADKIPPNRGQIADKIANPVLLHRAIG